MRVWLTVLVLVFAPTLVRAQAEPSLEVTQDAEGWRFEVVNPGDQPLRLMTGPPRLSRALVRVDVRQPDGGWTAAHALTDFDLSLDQGRMVVPARGRVRLQPRLMFPVAELLGSPGHYRVVVFPHTPTGRVNLAQELDVSGWSTSLRDQAEDLRSRSLAAGCRVLPRRIDRHNPTVAHAFVFTRRARHAFASDRVPSQASGEPEIEAPLLIDLHDNATIQGRTPR
ncbi:MAG: hypothetical protein AB8I08_17125, partial [Sandaracinaceae bacterium]